MKQRPGLSVSPGPLSHSFPCSLAVFLGPSHSLPWSPLPQHAQSPLPLSVSPAPSQSYLGPSFIVSPAPPLRVSHGPISLILSWSLLSWSPLVPPFIVSPGPLSHSPHWSSLSQSPLVLFLTVSPGPLSHCLNLFASLLL